MNQEIKNRIKNAVSLLKEGKSFNVEGLLLEAGNFENFTVTGWSKYFNIKNINKQKALEELQNIKAQFYEFVNESWELQNLIQGKTIEFNLFFDDYGRASVAICSEKDGILKWELI